jgi:hypothetical protein
MVNNQSRVEAKSLENEHSILSELNHPNIIKVYG